MLMLGPGAWISIQFRLFGRKIIGWVGCNVYENEKKREKENEGKRGKENNETMGRKWEESEEEKETGNGRLKYPPIP